MKAQELKTKTSAQTLIYKIFLQRYQVYQGRLLASFQDDTKYEHVGQDTRSQGSKDDQDGRIKISGEKTKDDTWFKDKVLLVQAQANGQILHEEEVAFLADLGVVEGHARQIVITYNAAYQADDLDAYDFDCDELNTAKVSLMANLSHNGSDFITEVHNPDNMDNNMINQGIQARPSSKQSNDVNHSYTKINSDSNVIPYSQYVHETQQEAVQNSNSSAQQDTLILSMIEQLKSQVINYTKINLDNKSVNDTLTVELERYKEQVKVLKEGENIDLKSKDNILDSCEQSIEIDRLKKKKKSLMQTVTLLKNDFKKEESRNIDREIALEKKIKQLDNIVYKRDQLAQTKAQQLELKLYDGNVIKSTSAIVIPDSEETLMLAEESRSKMLLKQQDPIVLKKKVNTTPIDYANSMNSLDPSLSCRPTKVEVSKELPKVNMVNKSLNKLKHHLAGFDVVVKERTTATTITEGSWGFEHTKSFFRDEIIPFVKALKEIFNTFDQYLIDELTEVQNVFLQMEQAMEQHRLESKMFEVKLNQVLNENERLLEQVINKDIVNIIINSTVDNPSVNMHKCKKCLKLETELLNKKDFIEKETYDKLFRSYTALEKHCISLEVDTQLNQEIFQRDNSVSNQSALNFDQYFELNELKAQSQEKDTVIRKLKERIKSLSGNMNKDKVKKDIEEIETINIELDHRVSKLIAENEHLKQTYKQLYESIKPTHIRSKEQCDALINQVNQKSVKISDLNVSLQEKGLVITALKDEIRKLKGKYLADNIITKHIIAPEMLKFDVEQIAPKLLNNRTAHSDYLRHTQEQAVILREVVEQGKSQNPLYNSLDSACKYTKRIQELLIIIRQTCPSINNSSDKLVVVTPQNKDKRVRFTEPVTSSGNTNLKIASSLNLVSNKPMFSSTGVKPSTSASGSHPSSNTKKDKIQRTPSSTQKNKVEAYPRTVKSSLKNKNCVVERKGTANVHNSKLNANSKLLCVKCNGCMISDNHDFCLELILHEMTLATVSSGLMPNPPPSTPYVPPSRTDWDILFQPLFDELLNPPPSVDLPAHEVIALIAEVVALEPAASTDSLSSTTVDQDAPSPSNSQTSPETQSPVISNDVEEENHDLDVAHMNNDPFFGILIPENNSEASSSSDVIPTVVHTAAPNSEHVHKWTKDHPLDNIISELERPVSTIHQLLEQALFCYYGAFLTSVEPKTYKDALTQSYQDNPNHVYKLKEALYGLKQDPRAWCDLLSKFLLSQEFSKATVDPIFFIRRQGKDILLISQSPRGIFLNQSKYALEYLKKYGMESSDPVDTPMVEKSKLDKDTQGKAVDHSHYHGIVGTLMYLTASRPDLTFC
ncbi:integrase, catalytic region, zinc finger, CCHC-type containing protein [Tanacetum coccineum]